MGFTRAFEQKKALLAQASSNFAQLHAMPLIVVLTLEVFLSLRLVTSNTAFTDEAMYLWAGRLEWSHWLHNTPIPSFPTYFSGAPHRAPDDLRELRCSGANSDEQK